MTHIPLQIRRDTAANWASNNPVLKEGEIGLEIASGATTGLKLGDGSAAWSALPFFLRKTGWAFVKNGASTQTLVASTDTQVSIDGASVSTDETNWPGGTLWDTTNDKILATEDEAHTYTFFFTFTPSSGVASYIDVWLDIGGGVTVFPKRHDVLSGSGVDHVFYQVIPAFISNAFATNGGKIMVNTDGPGTLSAASISAITGHRV